tara:strand:- start:3260 stop:4084 length:825 start_codon:yes stop_codon:yes gene_type:complete
MFNMDYLLCQQAECAYDSFIALLDMVIEFPIAFLEQLRSLIKQLEVLFIDTLLKSADDLYNKIEDCLKMPDSVVDIAGDFCDALLQCEFLYKSMLPTGVDDAYAWIQDNICFGGLSNFLANIKSQFSDIIEGLVSGMLEGKYGVDAIKRKIQDAINKYQEFLSAPIKSWFPGFPTVWGFNPLFAGVTEEDFDPKTANIYDLIDIINQFADCVFSVCNLGESVVNKILDIEKKASLDIQARTYRPSAKDILVFTKLGEIQNAIDAAQLSPCFNPS